MRDGGRALPPNRRMLGRLPGEGIAGGHDRWMAIQCRDPAGTVVSPDGGNQLCWTKSVRVSAHHGLFGSMGRGACGDRAAMESFFALLQRHVLDARRRVTGEELRPAIVTRIERTGHRRRRQRALGELTPVEYGTTSTRTVDLAAWPDESTGASAVPLHVLSPGLTPGLSGS